MNALIEASNHAAAHWWAYVVHATWQSSLLAAVVLLAVWAGRRWRAQLRYALVLVALVKFAIPPMLALPVGLFSRLGPAVALPAEDAAAAGEADLADAPAEADGTSWAAAVGALGRVDGRAWMMMLHVLGALAAAGLVAHQVVQVQLMARRSKRLARGALCDHVARLSRKIGLRRAVRLYVSRETVSPMAFGVLHPSVLVPAGLFRDIPRPQMDTILCHELVHHRRGDIWVNWAQALLGVAWWFNPLFWLLNRTLRKTREDCCDDLLLARRLTTDGAYCEALLKVARQLSRRLLAGAASGFAQRFHPLGDRIRRIMDHTLRRAPSLSTVGFAVTLLVAGLVLPGLRTDRTPAQPAEGEAFLAQAGPFQAAAASEAGGNASARRNDLLLDVGADPDRGLFRTAHIPRAEGPHGSGAPPFGASLWEAEQTDPLLADGRLGELIDRLGPAHFAPHASGRAQPDRSGGQLAHAHVGGLLPIGVELPGGIVLHPDDYLHGILPKSIGPGDFAPNRLKPDPSEQPAPKKLPALPGGEGDTRFAQLDEAPDGTDGAPATDEKAPAVRIESPYEPFECLAKLMGPPETQSPPAVLTDPFGYGTVPDNTETITIALVDTGAGGGGLLPSPGGTSAYGDGFGSGDGSGFFFIDFGDFAPEPTALLALAVGGLLLRRRRRCR